MEVKMSYLGDLIMKKMIMTISLLFGMVVSSYALTISTGGYFNLGGNDSSRIETNGISYGVGAFFNIDLFLGLGLQSEINCTNSVINTGENQIIISDIDTIVDIPFMFWWNGKFGFLGVGAGAGINLNKKNEVKTRKKEICILKSLFLQKNYFYITKAFDFYHFL